MPYKAAAYYDPAMAYVNSQSIRPATPDGTTPGWFRASITGAAPTEYAPGPAGKLWGRAAFARVGILSNSASAATGYGFDRAQMERTRTGNLLTVEQSSYEGRMCYTTAVAGASYSRSTDTVVTGRYSGKYLYQLPPVSNSYDLVRSFGTYQNVRDLRQNYAQLLTNPPLPGEQAFPTPPPVGTGPTIFTVSPNLLGLVAVVGGTPVSASIGIAAQSAGLTLRCDVLRYDAAFNLLSASAVTYVDVTSTAGFHWQTPAARLTLEATAAWAAVVPVVIAGSAQSSMAFYADQHRISTPTTVNPAVHPASPARTWQEPRKIVVKVRADRVNLATNPGFMAGIGGWSPVVTSGLPNTLTTKSVTGYSGNTVTVLSHTIPAVTTSSLIADGWYGATTAGMLSGPTGNTVAVTGLKPGTTYTASVWVKAFLGQAPVTCWFYDGTQYVRGTRTGYVGLGVPRTWERLSVTFTTSRTFSGDGILRVGWSADDMSFVYSNVSPSDLAPEHWRRTDAVATRDPWVSGMPYSTGDVVPDASGQNWYAILPSGVRVTLTSSWEMYVYGVLVEEGAALLPYFDGNSPGSEYLWENSTVNARSHYYRGLNLLRYRLDQAVRHYLPQGSSYQILYASAL
ncbi:hypothetical protein [Streptomyces sp. CBMA29]|uniref:hypothetical protein n=1 Tax=Streptomyces sp. CBMA29 TaxID=1896314 RepID=UPI0016619B86|nr:hypothetical protein [Streptomyces sp. CBMA29]MBD0734075.1 hypothetical protein [Streptomyces sp. CBMA29]